MEEKPLSLPLLGFLRQLERDIIMSILSFKKKKYDQSGHITEEKRGPGGKGGLAKTSVLFTMRRFFFEVGFVQGKQGSFHLRGWAVVLSVWVRTHTRAHTCAHTHTHGCSFPSCHIFLRAFFKCFRQWGCLSVNTTSASN